MPGDHVIRDIPVGKQRELARVSLGLVRPNGVEAFVELNHLRDCGKTRAVVRGKRGTREEAHRKDGETKPNRPRRPECVT